LQVPRPTPKLEDHHLSAVRDCLFNIFAATLHSYRPFLHSQPEDAPCCGDRNPLVTGNVNTCTQIADESQRTLAPRHAVAIRISFHSFRVFHTTSCRKITTSVYRLSTLQKAWESRFNSRHGQDVSIYFKAFRQALKSNQPPVPRVPGTRFPSDKATEM
jgi:hypothetical protein